MQFKKDKLLDRIYSLYQKHYKTSWKKKEQMSESRRKRLTGGGKIWNFKVKKQ